MKVLGNISMPFTFSSCRGSSVISTLGLTQTLCTADADYPLEPHHHSCTYTLVVWLIFWLIFKPTPRTNFYLEHLNLEMYALTRAHMQTCYSEWLVDYMCVGSGGGRGPLAAKLLVQSVQDDDERPKHQVLDQARGFSHHPSPHTAKDVYTFTH